MHLEAVQKSSCEQSQEFLCINHFSFISKGTVPGIDTGNHLGALSFWKYTDRYTGVLRGVVLAIVVSGLLLPAGSYQSLMRLPAVHRSPLSFVILWCLPVFQITWILDVIIWLLMVNSDRLMDVALTHPCPFREGDKNFSDWASSVILGGRNLVLCKTWAIY